MQYIIIYDIPREMKSFQVWVNRALKKAGAEKFQHSVWECPDLASLKEISRRITKEGGVAVVLEKKIV